MTCGTGGWGNDVKVVRLYRQGGWQDKKYREATGYSTEQHERGWGSSSAAAAAGGEIGGEGQAGNNRRQCR